MIHRFNWTAQDWILALGQCEINGLKQAADSTNRTGLRAEMLVRRGPSTRLRVAGQIGSWTSGPCRVPGRARLKPRRTRAQRSFTRTDVAFFEAARGYIPAAPT